MPTPRKATREIIEPIAADHTVSEMGRILGMSASVIARACEKFGITPKRLKTNDYSNLPELAETMYMAELARHYGVSYGAMCKTCHRLGVHPIKQTEEQKREVAIRACAAARAAQPTRLSPRLRTQFHTAGVTDHRAKTTADLAQEFLQKECAVFHCTEDGKPDQKGKFYKRGSRILTPDELIAMATRKGWKPESWKALAA